MELGSESCCAGKREMRTACVPGVGWIPGVHSVCHHNEIAAILTRSLGRLPEQVFLPCSEGVSREFARLARFARRYDGGTWSHVETAMSYTGRLRGRYLEAAESLAVDGPVGRRDWFLRPFLKAEKIALGVKKVKPRLIYPRSPRYNLELASRLKPFEHWLWGRLTASVVFGGDSSRVVAKGLNPRRRANLIVRKMGQFVRPLAVEIDGRAFEAHVGRSLLEGEHSIYRAAFPGDPELVRLLSKQLTLAGELPCGAKFDRDGGRASGDFNTGMGNSLVMLAVVVDALRSIGRRFDVLVDGDNAMLFMEASDYDYVMGRFADHVLRSSGLEITLECPVDRVELVRFGQSAPVFLGSGLGWTMVRDPLKVLCQAFSSHRWLREPGFRREWMRGVASCELSLAIGLPVLQAFFLAAQRQLGGPEGVRQHPHEDLLYKGAWFAAADSARRVGSDCRSSFELAFGITTEEQVAMEEAFMETFSDVYEVVAISSMEPDVVNSVVRSPFD